MVPSLGLEALLSGKINRFLFAKRWGTNGVCESDVFPWHTSNIETHTHLGKTHTHTPPYSMCHILLRLYSTAFYHGPLKKMFLVSHNIDFRNH